MNLFSWMPGPPATEAEVRAEIWRLGQRHLGRPLEGAQAELRGEGLPVKKALLLRACIRQLQAEAPRTRFARP